MAVLERTVDLWEKWNKELLIQKHDDIGSREFARGWKQQALSDDETLFKDIHIKQCIDDKKSLYFPGEDLSGLVSKGTTIFFGVDLAIASKKSQGDFFVIIVVLMQAGSTDKQVVGMFRDRGLTFNQQLMTIETWAETFNPNLILVENNAYQSALVQELHRQTELPVAAFTTTGVKKHDIDDGLPRMSIEFEQNRWTIPNKGVVTRELMSHLVRELTTFPIGQHDDCVMAAWFARNAAVLNKKRSNKRIFII